MSNGQQDALHWYKSSYSGNQGGQCVEVARAETVLHVRDSQHPTAGTLGFTLAEWQLFAEIAKTEGC